MAKIMAAISRFPEHELAIRRLCGQDSNFIETCEDYQEAATALCHWENAGPGYVARANEYRDILDEIEADILKVLSMHLLRVPHHGS